MVIIKEVCKQEKIYLIDRMAHRLYDSFIIIYKNNDVEPNLLILIDQKNLQNSSVKDNV